MKYGNVTLGQVEAAINKLGGREVWDALLRGEKTVTVKDAARLFFDKHGRRIPESLKGKVCDANLTFRLNQPKLEEEDDFANRILRLHGSLDIDTKVTAEQLKAETERLLGIIRENAQIANIANGVCLPVVLPRLDTDDLGAELEIYLTGVNNSYVKTFSDRTFNNYRKGDLIGKVCAVPGSRHDQLISRMKGGPVIGLHFPQSLQGFSIHASREQMPALPEGFILSGIDTPIAMLMYPDILVRNWNSPGLDIAALLWQSENSFTSYDHVLRFKALAAKLIFVCTGDLSQALAYDCFSSGLLFLG